ncbi:LytR/AlgR family response regulator transcription factor [Aureivirga sp. CE67]|uniref:LytR/AlgR family response regulator transcription factor n=1 Tax=Aureivirga sp. CE67 TaxID=1788983 RepID=UPI0018CA4263|nr:LytTR family DNA-binding domain-containing protein [Aureivirga sp. CE67]
MKCLIIDDEPLAVDIIEAFTEKIPFLEVVKTFNNALDAFVFLNSNKVDLLFLDIEMPNLTGVEMVKSLQNSEVQVIFTTAYSEYALEGFNLNATDYLLKPIAFPRFLKAVNKAKEKFEAKQENISTQNTVQNNQTTSLPEYIFVKSEYENLKINLSEIVYIQGLKDYIKIYLKNADKAILTLSSFKEILKKLPVNFLRIHRSYIVNVDFINSVQKSKVIIEKQRIPIGETYKEEVFEKLGI